VTAIDVDEKRVAEVASEVTLAAQGDGSSEELLYSLQVNKADVGVVGQGRNLEANLLTTLLLKKIGVPYVVAKATSELHGQLLSRIGADRVIFPERDEGTRLAHALAVPSITDYISLSATGGVARFKAPAHFVDQQLSELLNTSEAKLNVMIIKRGSTLIMSPSFTERILSGDELVVAGPDADIEQFVEQVPAGLER
jgi:trk system potassium uptake protein TrkA